MESTTYRKTLQIRALQDSHTAHRSSGLPAMAVLPGKTACKYEPPHARLILTNTGEWANQYSEADFDESKQPFEDQLKGRVPAEVFSGYESRRISLSFPTTLCVIWSFSAKLVQELGLVTHMCGSRSIHPARHSKTLDIQLIAPSRQSDGGNTGNCKAFRFVFS